MMKKLFAIAAATFLLGACDEPKPATAPPPPPPPAPQSFMVFFDWDRATLNTQASNVVSQAATAFKTRGGVRITATGHTDTSGSEQYNMALSLRRANAVKDALVKEAVPATAITVVGRGEQGLLVQTGPDVREPQNRRVEIVLGTQMAGYDQAAYCKALMDLYRKTSTGVPAQGPVPEAMAECVAGRPANGIPVLEKSLVDAKVPLPPKM